MKHEKSDYAITKELIEFVNEIDLNEEQQYQIKACQIILVDIFMPENEKEKNDEGGKHGKHISRKLRKKTSRNPIKKINKRRRRKWRKKWGEKGMKKGMKDATEKFARKLKEDNIPIEKIAQYTELSPNEIESL